MNHRVSYKAVPSTRLLLSSPGFARQRTNRTLLMSTTNNYSPVTPRLTNSVAPRATSALAVLYFFLLLSVLASTAGAVTSNGTGGGLWSNPATWSGGVVPAGGDPVIIANGDTVTIDTAVPAAGSLASLTVGQGASGTLTFDGVAARAVSVSGNVV